MTGLQPAARALVAVMCALLSVMVGGACAQPGGGDVGEASGPGVSAPTPGTIAGPVASWPANVPRADTLANTPDNARIRRGLALLTATGDSLPAYVGNGLRCVTCHLDEGRRKNGLPWVGLVSRFPQFRTRNAFINQLEDRINDCIERSLAGRPLPHDDEAVRDMIAYFRFLSRGVAPGHRMAGQGAPKLALTEGDTVRGADVYRSYCARCHGANGEGSELATPLWGDRSYSIGAGMARPRTAAAFIHTNMPYDNPSLSEQQAMDVATWVNAQPRPDFARTVGDWPFGGAPADVPYRTASPLVPR